MPTLTIYLNKIKISIFIMTLKIKPGYKHLIQKRNFCGPACLQMILLRRGIWYEQEPLSYKLDAKIDRKEKDMYLLPFKKMPSGDSRIGLKIKEFNGKTIKNFLKKFDLEAEVYLISQIKNLSGFIVKNIKEKNDIMINYWVKILSGKDSGHYVLLSEFDRKNNILTVCDPSPTGRAFWKVGLGKIKRAMSSKWDGNERGFVIIKPR